MTFQAEPFFDRPGRRTTAMMVLCAMTFCASLFLFTRANQFPFLFHPDEPSKAEQIATGHYNFNHPQLTLRAAQAIVFLRTGELDGRVAADDPYLPHYQRIAESGRWASAIFAALAVATLTGLACSIRGVVGGLAVAGGLTLSPSLLANAHYVKEDTAFVFTISVWLATAAWFLNSKTRGRLIAFGVACGLMLCGKWIGGVLTIAGLVLIASVGRDGKRLVPTLLTLAAAAVTFVLINLPALWQFGNMIEGWKREADHVATGHAGLILPRLSVYGAELYSLGGVLFVLVIYEAFTIPTKPDRRWRGWWLVPALAVGLFALVSLSRVVSPRYILPSVVLLVMFGGMGIGSLATATFARTARSRGLQIISVVGLLLICGLWLVPQALRSLGYLKVFQRDTRLEAREWLQANLPSDAKLAHDAWTGLWHWDVPVPSTRIPLILNETTTDTLTAEGYTHLAVADRSYEQFFMPGVDVTDDFGETFDRVRQRYGELLKHKPLVEFAPPGPTPPHMSPTIRIYRLPLETP